MKRTCITCFYHKDERGHITCGLNGHCIFGDCYTPMRGSLEEIEMAVEPWKKAMALYDAQMLNWKDASNEYKAELDALNKKIYEITAIDIGDDNDETVLSVFDKQNNTISSRIITTDNPDIQSWRKRFQFKEDINRLCNCDGMNKCLPHEEKEAHEEGAANNESRPRQWG